MNQSLVLLALVLPFSFPVWAQASPDHRDPGSDASALFAILDTPDSNTLTRVKDFLKDHSVPVDAVNSESETPLLHSIKRQEYDVFYYLDQFYGSPDVNQHMPANSPEWQKSIYTYGLEYGDAQLIAYLKKRGGDINRVADHPFQITDLIIASFTNTPQIVQLLLQQGADVNHVASGGDLTALIAAAISNPDPEVVRVLAAAGADVNFHTSMKDTALSIAANRNSNAAVLQALIQAGADVNTGDITHSTPLMGAVLREPKINLPFVQTLLQAGAAVNQTDAFGETALIEATWRPDQSVDLIHALLQAGADLNHADEVGFTPLVWAAAGNRVEIVKTLIQAGADVNQADGHALNEAVSSNPDIEVTKTLIQAGADVSHVNSSGMTAMMEGAHGFLAQSDNMKFNVVPALEALIQAGADVNQTNQNGDSALIWAATNSNVAVTQALIRFGADVNLRDKQGYTALGIAKAKNQNPAVAQAIMDAGGQL
jgi:ankyrin repeat protein